MYIWDTDIEKHITSYWDKKGEPPPEIGETLLTYYRKIQTISRKYLQEISEETFLDILPKLFGLDTKCQILIFYLTVDYELQEESEEKIIELIEKDYIKVFYENQEFINEYSSKFSLLTNVS